MPGVFIFCRLFSFVGPRHVPRLMDKTIQIVVTEGLIKDMKAGRFVKKVDDETKFYRRWSVAKNNYV